MMQLRDISFCAFLRDRFTADTLTAATVACGHVSSLNCHDTALRARTARHGCERRILLSHILILLSCCLPLAFSGRISGATAPAITSPAPGSVLPGSTATFSWTAASGVVLQYQLWVGSAP